MLKQIKDLQMEMQKANFQIGDEVLIPKAFGEEKRDRHAYVHGVYSHHIVFQYADTKQRVSYLPSQYKNFRLLSNALPTSREPKNLDDYYKLLKEDSAGYSKK